MSCTQYSYTESQMSQSDILQLEVSVLLTSPVSVYRAQTVYGDSSRSVRPFSGPDESATSFYLLIDKKRDQNVLKIKYKMTINYFKHKG